MAVTETIVILRPTPDIGLLPGDDEFPGDDLLPDDAETDEQGNPVQLGVHEIESDGWAVAPLTADEDSVATGQRVIPGYTLYRRDAWVDVRPDDRVRLRGEVLGVTSPSAPWEHPRTGFRGTVVVVRRVA